ncbi:MAG: GNAT family N-acetyltransferase [Deltaproteobacteria bacterium]|uniref:GNAT family N-acetyltransferase n=1 Tax=Desulfobacula sp. TaxID=2593537 RepID=UPI00199BEE0F|nr:GNAT family N-acetyltransferase [Candidatus Desulfobacula maris]MBL6992777.1 GNAT family N-acetyltransferase [Desulfobacula sp.]
MSKFEIIQDSPHKYKDKIFDFWKEYLPGTPAERLDWMENNPAGPAIWLFAIEEKTGSLAGTISLFPKEFFLNSKKIKAAVLGDFMLHSKFRVFGPALALLKAAITYQKQEVFDFLYTIPNLKSKKLVEKAGFRLAGELYFMMHPQRCEFLLKKYIGFFLAAILDMPLSLLLKFFSSATYASRSAIFKEIDRHDDAAVNEFCKQIRKSGIGLMTGEYSSAYIDWRYRKNPEFDFQIFSLRKKAGEVIQGLFIISLRTDRLVIYDIVALDNKNILSMINKIMEICKKRKFRGIYCSIYENNPLLSVIKRSCFFDTKEQIELYTYPEKIKETELWAFTSADRNI